MLGPKFRVLAWNFIPMKCGKDGFLEIIRWDLAQPSTQGSCSLSRFSSFCCTSGVCHGDCDRKAKSFVFGVVESVSPVSVVPCSSKESNAVYISGFLVNVRVCECELCSSKLFVSELGNLKEGNVGDHCFGKTAIVYFCGSTSSWHPIVSTLIGNVVLILSLKKKLVFIGKDQPQLMHVAGDGVSLHVIKMFKTQNGVCHDGIRGKGRCGSYTGVITGIYMKGMVVELDQDVLLVVTDQYLCVPHCMRVGAIVTLKNVHFVDPKFMWGKMLILGACCQTSMFVESFSPLKLGVIADHTPRAFSRSSLIPCHFQQDYGYCLLSHALRESLLAVFLIRRFWVQNMCSQKEGMVQKYAGSYLPSSAFRLRHGVLSEFCKHDSCSDVEEGQYRLLRLVLPIANLISYCDSSWKRSLNDSLHNLDFVGGIDHRKPLFCDGIFYEQSTRKVLRTEEIGVLVLGTLKISTSSGRLQLVDATGGVDIMLDLPPIWNFDKVFEAKNFVIVMEGIQWKLVDLNTTKDQPLSCRSIFSNAPLMKRLATSLYLYHDPRDEDNISDSLFFDWKIISKELGCGKYHLLMLTHKFPFQKKLHGYQTNRSIILAEAIVLPFDLLITSKHEDAVLTRCQWKNSLHDLTNHKRHKINQVHLEICDNGSADARNGLSDYSSGSFSFDSKSCSTSSGVLEIPCMISSKGLLSHSRGILHCTSKCKPPSKVLLEFGPDSFCKYTVLKVGRCYLLDYQESLLSTMGNHKFEGSKLFISSNTNLRFLNFSSTDGLQNSDVPNVFSFPKLCPNIGNGISKEFEIPILTRDDTCPNESYLGVNIFVAAAALNILLNTIKIWNNDPFELKDSLKEESDICAHHGARITSVMQSSGPSCIDYPLPVGNLITLNGLVVGLHDCDGNAFHGQSRLVPGKGSLPMFLQRNGGICVHLLVEDCMVMIFCDLSKQAHPVGLGQDVYATFHRILVLSGMNKYMMLPVSSITINNVCLVKRHTDAESRTTLASLGLDSVAFPNTDAAQLIYDVLESSLLEPRQFRCRVVAVYLLEVVSSRHARVLQSSGHTELSSFGIPLAGFIMDDGSSTFCCWSESEKAATLLGLNFEGYALRLSPDNIGNDKSGTGLGYGSRVNHLNQILERHGRLVVKNCGSIVDSSCQDLAFSFGSDKSISISSEDILMSLVISPLGTFWCVTDCVMEEEGSRWLANRLSEVGMALPSSVRNVWATSVRRTDVLSEARIMLQEVAIV